MLPQFPGLSKCFVALCTFVRFLSSVNLKVNLQSSSSTKRFVTLSTFVQLLSRMRQQMPAKNAGLWKWLETYCARMKFVSHLDSCKTYWLVFSSGWQWLKIFWPWHYFLFSLTLWPLSLSGRSCLFFSLKVYLCTYIIMYTCVLGLVPIFLLLWMYCEWRQECNAMVHWFLHGPTGPHSLYSIYHIVQYSIV